MSDKERELFEETEAQRGALFTAYQILKEVVLAAQDEDGDPVMDLSDLAAKAQKWIHLNQPKLKTTTMLDIVVEDDEDPEGTPTEGEFWEKDSPDRADDPRSTPEAQAERAAWTRDLARILREQTAVDAKLRPGVLWAADFLHPDPTDGR